ncbi:hypothetical protein KKI24_27285 [bacterium]|nr:hypothetical protein [bacterium]
MGGLGIGELFIMVIFAVVYIIPFWKIFSKAGYPGIMALTQFVPILNFIVLYYVAFAKWPIQNQIEGKG